MSQHSENEIIPVIPSTPEATLPNTYEKRVGPTAEVEREGRDTDKTLVLSAILSNWTVAAVKRQLPDCWDVRHFEAMFSGEHTANI